jgi:transglutaminase-like putative cysteine protease
MWRDKMKNEIVGLELPEKQLDLVFENYPEFEEKEEVASWLTPYLVATTNCQSNDSGVIRLAKKIKNGKTGVAGAQAIYNYGILNWDYRNYSNTMLGALNMLKQKLGNCCDHTHALNALLRAGGYAARYEHVNGKFSSGIEGHVMPSVYLNSAWVRGDTSNNINVPLGTIKSPTNIQLLATYATLPF